MPSLLLTIRAQGKMKVLVDFIVEHTKKIKPLAASDLDSFVSLGREFLNIGKPFNLPNIGTLEKLNSGVLAFVPGQLIAQRIEPNQVKNEEEIDQDTESFFNDYKKETKAKNGGKTVLMILLLVILGFVVWAVWRYAFTKKERTENLTSTEGIVPVKDSSQEKDTAAKNDSMPSAPITSDTVSFNVVVSEYHTKSFAEKRLKDLKSYHRNVILYTDDSVTYKIAEPFNLPLADTTKILDSLRSYYAKVVLEIK